MEDTKITKDKIYSSLREAKKRGESGSTCNTAAYAAGISRRELASITQSKMFSGANHMRFISGTEIRYKGEPESYWMRGIKLLESLGIPQQRKDWQDRPDEDVTGLSQNIESSNDKTTHSVSYLPIKVDVDFALSQLRTSPHEEIGVDAVLDQVKVNFDRAGKPLKPNWREITKRNIETWYGTNG